MASEAPPSLNASPRPVEEERDLAPPEPPAWTDPDSPPTSADTATTWDDKRVSSGPTHAPPKPGAGDLITFRQFEQQAKRQHLEHLEARQTKHTAEMQTWVLLGIGTILLVVFTLLLAAVWNHAVTPEFALEIGRMILPALLGSAATIVGALFVSGQRKKS